MFAVSLTSDLYLKLNFYPLPFTHLNFHSLASLFITHWSEPRPEIHMQVPFFTAIWSETRKEIREKHRQIWRSGLKSFGFGREKKKSNLFKRHQKQTHYKLSVEKCGKKRIIDKRLERQRLEIIVENAQRNQIETFFSPPTNIGEKSLC